VAIQCGCDSHNGAPSRGVDQVRRASLRPQADGSSVVVGAEEDKECEAFVALTPPASDKPDAATAAVLNNCDTEALLYGIGMKRDVVRARQCAYVEKGSDQSLGGVAALMTIYANGWGVKQDLDLAAHFACAIDAAPAETEARLKHLATLKAGGPQAKPFDTCDDLTSGMWGGICNARDERIKDIARNRSIDGALSGWSKPERAAYTRFTIEEKGYIDAQAGEVDASGTLRTVFWQEAERQIRDRALATLRRFGRDDGFDATPEQRMASDRDLNLTYHQVMSADAGAWEDMGTVKPEDVRTAQRAWIKYRDAWLELATAKGRSSHFADGLAVALTDQRAHALRCLMQLAKPNEKCETDEGT
jgi:uncharacterized protein YecT (DUF1311 family)